MRITNYVDAYSKLAGLAAMLITSQGILYMVLTTDAGAVAIALATTFMLGVVWMAFDAVRKAVFWVELGAEGVRARRALGTAEYRWNEIGRIGISVHRLLPGRLRQATMTVAPRKGHGIRIILSNREWQMLRPMGAFFAVRLEFSGPEEGT